MKQREQLFIIKLNGTERAALLRHLENITVTDYTPELVNCLIRLDEARPVNTALSHCPLAHYTPARETR